ncbi:hypothetical protein ES703_00071 [subsurface metagenome]
MTRPFVTKMVELLDEDDRKDNKEIARYLATGLYSFESNGQTVTIGRRDKLMEYIRRRYPDFDFTSLSRVFDGLGE